MCFGMDGHWILEMVRPSGANLQILKQNLLVTTLVVCPVSTGTSNLTVQLYELFANNFCMEIIIIMNGGLTWFGFITFEQDSWNYDHVAADKLGWLRI